MSARLAAHPRSWWVKRGLGVLLGLIIVFYPSIFSNSPAVIQNSQWMPQLTTMVPVLVFVIMALGLNVVVGYAGLLDLGYVAFYAAGAYVAGSSSRRTTCASVRSTSPRRRRGSTSRPGS
jgi:ABC-type branched-subunit amino acid transport system permease subunit